MPQDLTKAVTVKRNAKKKSGYIVSEQEGYYYVKEAPAKARVNPGDKVVGINGIKADEFLDEDDANNLIESIRIVVIPQDKIEEYDNAKGAADEEEQYEEYDRRSQPKNTPRLADGKASSVPGEDGPTIHHCNHCGHDNEDLSEDDDGDLVCEECGHVIEPPGKEDVLHSCGHCGHENSNLERDEDGDLVCEECGHVIPEEDALVVAATDEVYECPDCGHHNINPEPDEEGDLVCTECGCILPHKMAIDCEACGHHNVEPEQNEDGDYVCEHCGGVLDVEEQPEKTGAERLKEMNDKAIAAPPADGQQFDENGKPITNPEGKKLTPADMFNPGDVITVTVGKSNPKQDAGLKIDEKNGKYYVRKVPSGGLFAKTPVIAGDKILELNGTDHHEFKNLNELKKILKDEERITVVVLRRDPDASESSASSVDYDELNPITPDGVVKDEIVDRDDDTVGYDGHDCGCMWCPDCH